MEYAVIKTWRTSGSQQMKGSHDFLMGDWIGGGIEDRNLREGSGEEGREHRGGMIVEFEGFQNSEQRIFSRDPPKYAIKIRYGFRQVLSKFVEQHYLEPRLSKRKCISKRTGFPWASKSGEIIRSSRW